MKKFYSIVLMAAALLVGTNAWAYNLPEGAGGSDLQAQINKIMSGETSDNTIVLQDTVQLGTTTIWVGTETYAGNYKKVIIDLNGFNITKSVANASHMFLLSHGELEITNTSADTAVIRMDGAGHSSATVFTVYGSYRSSRWNEDGDELKTDSSTIFNTRAANGGWFSHLTIGKRVKILACGQGSGIVVNGFTYSAKNAEIAGKNLDYGTNLNISTLGTTPSASYGFAYGVRVDVEGDIQVLGTSSASSKSYGIKVNGTVQSPISAVNLGSMVKKFGEASNIPYLANYVNLIDSIKDTYKTHRADTLDAPYIHVHPGSNIIARKSGEKSTAVYAAGYAKWMIEGYCTGKTGIYVSSGVVEFHDANIISNADDYTKPTSGGSANGGGSGLVVNSRSGGYSGDMDITISGDTKIVGAEGYAIEEIVNTKPTTVPDPENPGQTIEVKETNVQNITIEGGTIVGGDKGAIVVSQETVTDTASQVVVYGGDIQGTTQAGTTGDLDELVPTSGYHTTEVTVNGQTVVVVSKGEEPATANSVVGATDYTAIKWQNPGNPTETLSADKVLTELTINETYAQTLTIATGKKLIVGHVILGENAKIIVEAGAKLIVTGKQGIDAHTVDNIVLQSSEAAQAVLLFNPNVETNRQPKATVDLAVACGKDGTGENVWTRFAIPVQSLDALKRKYPYNTWVYEWDYDANQGQGDWALVNNVITDMKPWTGYTLSYNETTEEGYSFQGNLVGNANAAVTFVHRGYNYFGNSYSAYVDAKTLLQGLADEHIDGTIYMWNASVDNPANQGYVAVTLNRLVNQADKLKAWEKDVAPMQTFILQLRGANNAAESVDYASAVYNNPRHGNAGGVVAMPKHRAIANHSEAANIQIVVTAANGKSDRVNLTEGAGYTDAFESGFDASKYMNKNTVNLYATVNGENYSDVATNSLEGKMITLQTSDAAYYTISFDFAEGSEYAILDKVTNQVIAIEEGATYEFAAQPNSVVEGRFEIIDRYNAPTAIENTEVKANVKGIYTITGMYMGEDFDVLPAGVYVVDGVKIVK